LNTNVYATNHVSSAIIILAKFDNGSIYNGNMSIDKMFRSDYTPNGLGAMSYHDKSEYVGQWDNGYRNKQGTMYYFDGANYEGSWSQGERIGKGSYTLKNGKKISGEFSYGYFGWGIYKIAKIHYTWYAFLFWYKKIFHDEDFNEDNEKNIYLKYFDNLKIL